MVKEVNWGVIGLGNIALHFAKALKLNKNARLKGISSKTNHKILNFKKLFQIENKFCFDNYDDLINCDEIEAVYIALPNSMHYEYIIKCIKAKKKILVEKPAFQNFSEIKSIKENYNIKNIFFAEGFMYLHHPQILDLIQVLKDKKIGNLISINSKFGRNILKKKNFLGMEILKKQNIDNRLFNKNLGGGVILDLGCYPVSFCLLIASLYFSVDINTINIKKNRKQMGSTGVDIDASAEINFNGNFSAVVEASFLNDIGYKTEIIGDKGKIIIEDTWHSSSPIQVITNKNEEIFNYTKNDSYYYQVKNISNDILQKKNKPQQLGVDFEKSYMNMNILDKWIKNE